MKGTFMSGFVDKVICLRVCKRMTSADFCIMTHLHICNCLLYEIIVYFSMSPRMQVSCMCGSVFYTCMSAYAYA